jgi:hypothetical protein
MPFLLLSSSVELLLPVPLNHPCVDGAMGDGGTTAFSCNCQIALWRSGPGTDKWQHMGLGKACSGVGGRDLESRRGCTPH